MAGESTALVGALRELLGNVYGMYFRAHSAHWNVEGPFFGPLHNFFGELYEAVFDSADLVAEIMRFHRFYAPNSIQAVTELSKIDATQFPNGDPKPLLADLLQANTVVLMSLHKVKDAANTAGDTGTENKMQDLIFAHDKWAWKIRSHMKSFE